MAAFKRSPLAFSSRVFTATFRHFRHPKYFSTRSQLKQRYQYQRFGGETSQRSRFPGVYILQRWAARPTFYIEIGAAGALVGGTYVYNLETVPVSGRRRFNIISAETEAELAKEQYRLIMNEFRGAILSDWDPRVALVKRVLRRLIPASGLTDLNWEVHVIDSPEKNAFVIPGGKVFVFTGILPICRGEDGVATVLGHEIAHNVAHHAAERMSSGAVLTVVLVLLSWMFQGVPDVGARILLDLGFQRPGSRKQESEADYIGLMMMAQSCYDPDEAVRFWGRMQKAAEHEPPEFMSTHPSPVSRQAKLAEWLPEARDKQNQSDCSSTLSYADDFRKAFTQIRW